MVHYVIISANYRKDHRETKSSKPGQDVKNNLFDRAFSQRE